MVRVAVLLTAVYGLGALAQGPRVLLVPLKTSWLDATSLQRSLATFLAEFEVVEAAAPEGTRPTLKEMRLAGAKVAIWFEPKRETSSVVVHVWAPDTANESQSVEVLLEPPLDASDYRLLGLKTRSLIQEQLIEPHSAPSVAAGDSAPATAVPFQETSFRWNLEAGIGGRLWAQQAMSGLGSLALYWRTGGFSVGVEASAALPTFPSNGIASGQTLEFQATGSGRLRIVDRGRLEAWAQVDAGARWVRLSATLGDRHNQASSWLLVLAPGFGASWSFGSHVALVALARLDFTPLSARFLTQEETIWATGFWRAGLDVKLRVMF